MGTVAAEPRTAKVSPPPGITSQASYSGTPRSPLGWTQPDEYVRDLQDPIRRMELFEEMGNDEAVHTGIEARRQQINAANWTLSSEADADARAVEILEFIEDNIYPHLDRILRLLGGGAMQYGFGCLEPVFQWSDQPLTPAISRGDLRRATRRSGQRRIYLAKVAHIRPRAIETFVISPTGELETVRQAVFDGRTFRRTEIRASKLLLWSYDQQGDDCWGVPPGRHCYKGWKLKTQLERLNLLSFDRFGVGTPVAEEGQGWSQADRDRLAAYLKAWRSGAEDFVLHPTGGKITIVSGDGKMVLSALEWVRFYGLAIAKTFLTQQTELGSTETGARAVGETMYQQMEGIVQADCEELASLINNQLIVPLVTWNFGPQDVYPTFAPSQRVRANNGIGQVLQQLVTAGAVHVRPEDEAYLRDALGLPPVELATLRQEQEQRDAEAAALKKAQAQRPPGGSPQDGPPARQALRQLALAPGAPDPAMPGTSYRTVDFSTWEQRVLRPDVVGRDLDLEASRLAGEVQDVLRAIDADLAAQATRIAGRGPAALAAAVRTLAVPERLRTQLRTVLRAAAQRARDYGAAAVRRELERQLAPDGIGPQRPRFAFPGGQGMAPADQEQQLTALRAQLRTLAVTADDNSARDLHLDAEVDRAVEDEIDRREQATRSAVLTALAQAAGATLATFVAVVTTAVNAGLVGLSTRRTEANVQGVVNVGFGIGRADQADAIQEGAPAGSGAPPTSGLVDAAGAPIGLAAKVYSAVMDGGTCDECAKWDAAQFPIDYPEDFTGVQAPNPKCYGGYSRCRCVWIYVSDQESVPLVPSAKGPIA